MKIVAVDLQAMAPLLGVVQIQGDITKVTFNYSIVNLIIKWAVTPQLNLFHNNTGFTMYR